MAQSAVASGLSTLRMNLELYKTQLELLLGAELTGEITLGEVPEVTEAQLAAMDLEKDLAEAKVVSYELYAAAEALADAKETYEDAKDKYGYNTTDYRAAERTWEAAQLTYNNTIQGYEMKFRTLYAQVHDCKQILEAAKVALDHQQLSYQAAELRHQQGTISENALLDARDSLQEAEGKVKSAAYDLFSSYNNYCWAVQRGILN
jgi:outer membrane protein TolC